MQFMGVYTAQAIPLGQLVDRFACKYPPRLEVFKHTVGPVAKFVAGSGAT
jgi:hypothetical protein